MQKPRIPPHPTTKQEILFLRRMGFPAQKKMKPRYLLSEAHLCQYGLPQVLSIISAVIT